MGGSLSSNDASGGNPNAAGGLGFSGVNTPVNSTFSSFVDPAGAGGGTIGGLFNPAGNMMNRPLGEEGSAPVLAGLQQGTSIGDVQNAQGLTGNSLQSQQALLAALQGQNGLGAQSAMQNQLAAANGVGTQNAAISGLQNVAAQQAGTAGMYQNIANGQGPNVARSMLNQATGQNVANQAALMAGQRGAGANTGLIARQAAQQGSAAQQQAAGQGATMQAQQQVNALQGLSANQAAQAGTQQVIGALGSNQAGMQQAGANQIAGQQIAGTNANTQANLANQQQMQSALQGFNTAAVSNQGNVNAGNVGLAQTAAQGKQGIIGGLINAGGGAAKAYVGSARGGMVQMAEGGDLGMSAAPGPSSSFGQFLNNWNGGGQSNNMQEKPTETEMPKPPPAPKDPIEGIVNIIPAVAMAMAAEGGEVPAKVSDGEIVVPKNVATSKDPAKATERFVAACLAQQKKMNPKNSESGGIIKASSPNQKAVKSGNSYDNDKIDATLEEKQIVLPRSVTTSKNPVKASGEFVARLMAKRGKK